MREFGAIDILVNNAGILRDRMLFNMSEAEWDAVIAVHLKGSFNCTRHAAARMREQRRGRIVSMSSTSGVYGNSGQANYGAAKDGIAGLTRVVARDLGKYGITVERRVPRGEHAHDADGVRLGAHRAAEARHPGSRADSAPTSSSTRGRRTWRRWSSISPPTPPAT